MIIVSQDKTENVNYSNVVRLAVETATNGKFYVEAYNSRGDFETTLGKYATEERAKEILEEITIAYANITMMSMPKIDIHEFIPAKEIMRNLVYQMPEK